MTNYIILKRNLGMEVWEQFTAQAAISARQAIRQAVKGEEDTAEWVAVPVRSWKPVKVSIETALKFE